MPNEEMIKLVEALASIGYEITNFKFIYDHEWWKDMSKRRGLEGIELRIYPRPEKTKALEEYYG